MQSSSAAICLDRRQLDDRRSRSTSFWGALRLRGRRRRFRRVGEGGNVYVDCLVPRISGLAILVLIGSILDAYLTILHLQRGGREVNPLMVFALQHGYGVFIGVKIAVTCAGAWVLAAHQQFLLAWKALHGLAGVYFLLLIYHLLLIMWSIF